MISILMPIYNGIEFIKDSVYSVLNQTYQEWELIIGVNGHIENSDVYKFAKIAEQFTKKIRVYDLYEIKGKANALNKMLEYCTYEYVAILDVDDVWTFNKLETQVQFLNIYDVVGSQCVYFGGRNGTVPGTPVGDLSGVNFRIGNPVINSSAIIQKQLCYWNEEYAGVEDYDLWLRLQKRGTKFYNVPVVLVHHRIHSNSAFNTKSHNNKLEKILENYLKN
jgi:glycosyltransferase involved in cell wall biosynthesis